MNWIENLLIIIGVSLDLFATMECQGALVSKVNKKQLSLICLIVSAVQLLALFAGYFLSDFLYEKNLLSNEAILGEIVASFIFVGLGIRLIAKAIKNEHINEKLEQRQDYKRFLKMAFITAIYTILVGVAFGILGTNFIMVFVMIGAITAIFIVTGMYTGYRFGFEQKTKAYVAGAILLWAAGVDVIVRCAMNAI